MNRGMRSAPPPLANDHGDLLSPVVAAALDNGNAVVNIEDLEIVVQSDQNPDQVYPYHLGFAGGHGDSPDMDPFSALSIEHSKALETIKRQDAELATCHLKILHLENQRGTGNFSLEIYNLFILLFLTREWRYY